MKKLIPIFLLLLFVQSNTLFSQGKKSDLRKKNIAPIDTIKMVSKPGGLNIEISFKKGKEFNHPTFAIWLETLDGLYIQSLFVTRSFATGYYGHGDAGEGKWKSGPGESIRPAALPYWAHKHNVISRDSLFVPTPENPLPDAISGATPGEDFVLISNVTEKLPERFLVLFELNQAFDYNDYWTNTLLNQNKDYLVSGQPSLVYSVEVNLNLRTNDYYLNPTGHGSATGADGLLYTNLGTLTTAKQIAGMIKVKINE